MAPLEVMGSNTKALTLSFPQTKFPIKYENIVVVPGSSNSDVQVHITRQHVYIFSHTGCVTASVFILFDIFPNVYPPVNDILEIINEAF